MTTQKAKPNETPACCCVDFGTVIDNSDCVVEYKGCYSSQAEAEQALENLTQKARNAESDPCQITSTIEEDEGHFSLTASFIFSCATERMIFQLAMR